MNESSYHGATSRSLNRIDDITHPSLNAPFHSHCPHGLRSLIIWILSRLNMPSNPDPSRWTFFTLVMPYAWPLTRPTSVDASISSWEVAYMMTEIEWMSERLSELVNEWEIEWISEWEIEWISELVNDKVTEWVREWVNDKVNDKVTEWVRLSELVSDRLTEWVSERLSELVSDRDWMSEWEIEWINEWVSDRVTEWVWEIEWISECVSNRVTEWVRDWVN